MRNRKDMLFFVLFLLFSALSCKGDNNAASSDEKVPGVTESEILIGTSLALGGHAGYLGTQTLRGAMSYLNRINEQGGVHGRKIRVIAYDDGYDPPRCVANTQKLIIEGLRRAGREITREKFIEAIEGLERYFVGIGAGVSFGPNDHQGLDQVYFTEIKGGALRLMATQCP